MTPSNLKPYDPIERFKPLQQLKPAFLSVLKTVGNSDTIFERPYELRKLLDIYISRIERCFVILIHP